MAKISRSWIHVHRARAITPPAQSVAIEARALAFIEGLAFLHNLRRIRQRILQRPSGLKLVCRDDRPHHPVAFSRKQLPGQSKAVPSLIYRPNALT